MNTFAVVFLCFQACLVQNVFSQCQGSAYGAYSPAAYSSSAFGPAAIASGYNPALAAGGYAPATYGYSGYTNTYPSAYGSGIAAYGGAGEGNVAVAGELPVAGTTTFAGQVPIMGAVRYEGPVAAGGAVSIAGNCACGCGSPYVY